MLRETYQGCEKVMKYYSDDNKNCNAQFYCCSLFHSLQPRQHCAVIDRVMIVGGAVKVLENTKYKWQQREDWFISHVDYKDCYGCHYVVMSMIYILTQIHILSEISATVQPPLPFLCYKSDMWFCH